MITLLAHQRRQIISVRLPKSATPAGRIARCGAAIRKKHADMFRLAPRGWFGAARLLSLDGSRATYEVWIRHPKDCGVEP